MDILCKINFILENIESQIESHEKKIEQYKNEIELIRNDIKKAELHQYNNSGEDKERYHRQIKEIEKYIAAEIRRIKNIKIQAKHDAKMKK